MVDPNGFDAADLAVAILDLDEPASLEAHPPVRPPTSGSGSAIGWVLLVALVIALSVAISMAVQLGPEPSQPPEPPCGGLYSDCCVDDDGVWGSCDREPCDDLDQRRDDGRGLFDAEERFTVRPPLDRC